MKYCFNNICQLNKDNKCCSTEEDFDECNDCKPADRAMINEIRFQAVLDLYEAVMTTFDIDKKYNRDDVLDQLKEIINLRFNI